MDGPELKAELRRHGLRQKELARVLGVREETVSRWAQDRLETPLYAIAYLRDVPACIKPPRDFEAKPPTAPFGTET